MSAPNKSSSNLNCLDSCSPPPSSSKECFDDLWSKLEDTKKSKIIKSLSAKSMLLELDPVIVMDYCNDTLTTLHTHLANLPIGGLPTFLGGVMPATASDLARTITNEVANGLGTVVSAKVIQYLTSFQGCVCFMNAYSVVKTVLALFIGASGAGVLVNICHMVSHKRQPPNNIGMNTLTL